MCETMKIVTSNSSSTMYTSTDFIYVESPEAANQVYVINTAKSSSPCDNCPNNPAVNKFATGVCHCTLNLPEIL